MEMAMLIAEKPKKYWSDLAFRILVIAFFATIILGVCDGIMKGYFVHHTLERISYEMYLTWIYDFRILGEQIILAAAVFFIGAKIFWKHIQFLQSASIS
jgi:hypothetical protein